MADRVHTDPASNNNNSLNSGDCVPPPPKNPSPGTYVIQIPKDQVYRVPPPENAARFNLYTRHNHRPCPCRRFLCSILLLILLLVLSGIASALFFLILRPVSPRYSILAITINGIKPNTTSISPQFNVTVRADNPNRKIGIYYEKNSSVAIYFSDVMLCEGELPLLYQPSSNVTVMAGKLKGSSIRLWSSKGKALQDWEKQGKVRLMVDLRAPMKVKVYSVKTWTIRAKVSCKILAKKVNGKTKVMEEKCDHSVKLW